jgi:tetratricopeptide (TPR) repeat protein
MPTPSNAVDFVSRGMAHYARQNYTAALADFSQAVKLDPASIDAYYGLGMAYKAQPDRDAAVEAFQKVITLITAANHGENRVKHFMLRRLALAHINEITQGDWNLEKEIWHHVA